MRLDRLRRMSRDEVRWRLAVAARTAGGRLAHRMRAARWNRAALAAALAPSIRDREISGRIRSGEWQAVHDILAARILARPARFVLDPASAPQTRALIESTWPGAAAEASGHAHRLLARQYDLLGYRGLSFTDDRGAIDWHFDPVHDRRAPRRFYADVPYLEPAVGDHKVIWEINRHQHWLPLGRAAWLTGDARYAAAILDDLRSWLDANPPLTGINWASMLEIGFRSISWTWALHCLLALRVGSAEPAGHSTQTIGTGSGGDAANPPTPWLVDMLVGLDRQLTHVEQNLSYYFSPNTHLTGEALALYVTGTALPELAASERWRAVGRRILLDEIGRQIDPDGGHAERSTHYQRYTLDFYLLALRTARLAGDTEAADRFAEVATRLADFTASMADDDGRLPLIGDDDGGMLWPLRGRACNDVRDSLAVAAAVLDRPGLAAWGQAEETVWIAGPALAAAAAAGGTVSDRLSRAFPGTGYFVARDGAGAHAVFDAGAHGYMNAGHAHADALSLTLTLDGKPLLIDPGTSTYTAVPAIRDRLRSSMSHNTLTIDGRSQSVPAGPFHWRTRADARLHEWRHNPAFDWVEGSHGGYAPLQHRRTLLRTDAGWIVADEILGEGAHAAAAHWHFDPAWSLSREEGRLRATHVDGAVAWLAHDGGETTVFRADEDAGLGWFAPVYGTLVPTSTARIAIAGDAPLTLLTWIGRDRDRHAPVVERIAAQCDALNPAVAGQVRGDDGGTTVFMFRPGGAVSHAARTCRVADFQTDARVLHYRASDDRLQSLDLVDGRFVTTARRGWISLEADEPMTDLHVRIAEGVLDLQASMPPARLRVNGHAGSVRLNGRPLPLSSAAATRSLLIRISDWRDFRPDSGRDAAPSASGAGFAQD
jgi:hypothetical protein